MKDVKSEKQILRKKLLKQYESLDLEKFIPIAIQKISNYKPFIDAEVVFIYKPFGHEVDFVDDLIKRFPDKKYFFPKTKDKDIYFDIPLSKADIVFVPAVAVDKNCNRLGRGWGSYDRFLAKLKKQNPNCESISVVPKIAVLESLPVQKHDMPVNKIIVL